MEIKTLITLEDVEAITDLVNGLFFINEITHEEKNKIKTIIDKINQRIYEFYKNKNPETIINDKELINLIHNLQIEYLKLNKKEIKI